MDSKKSKKSRSHGEASKTPRNSHSSPSPTSGTRPPLKDRVNSAPLVAQSSRQYQSRISKAQVDPLIKDGPRLGWSSPTQEGDSSPIAASSDQIENDSSMQEITLAVLGAPGTGKSTFVRCALDLRKPAVSPSSIKKVSLEGTVSVLRLLELQLNDLEIAEDYSIQWPTNVGDQSMPQIDGVLVMCDVMDQHSTSHIHDILKTLTKLLMPTVLVFSKCDNPRPQWQIDQHTMESFCDTFDRLESLHTSAQSPETFKRCISIILRSIMSVRSGDSQNVNRSLRPRALTNAQIKTTPKSLHSSEGKSKHSRAASELSTSQMRTTTLEPSKIKGSISSISIKSPVSADLGQNSATLLTDPNSQSGRRSPDDSDAGLMLGTLNLETKDSTNSTFSSTSRRPSASADPDTPNTIANSLLEFIDNRDNQNNDMVSPRTTNEEDVKLADSKESGTLFDELVDRLLSPLMSKLDTKFVSIFLCLYRKFAAPSDLMSAIIVRFEKLNDNDESQIVRITSQLRYLGILAQWVSDYPGDFAHQMTRQNMANFIASLGNGRVYAVASKEIISQLDVVVEDDDTEWACSDTKRSRASTVESYLSISSPCSANRAFNDISSTEDLVGDLNFDEPLKHQSTRNSATLSTSSSTGRSGSQSTGSFQTLLNSVESAQRQAQLLTPIPRDPLTKVQWHQLMDTPDEDIARELTRIDWTMFSSIRPRDFVRHVSLTADQKKRCKSLENVNRMICHFNHVAFWVANLVLLRDKPKHRAKALEKFMAVAWKLRYLNNYNSLGAVIAGINGTAVHRLVQTRELIPLQSQKQFMRLEILMGTQKSHFAYRLAWANTSSERIPFLPLHRRDLVFAEEGNQTYIGGDTDCINWKKFDIMGDVIVGIQKSQSTPYQNISRNEGVQRLVLDGKFTKDDDELYDRSIQIEGPGVGENVRRRFNWFQR